jgi:hypothetical protein
MFSLVSIRAVHDFDWKGQMREFFPDAVEVPHAGGVYYRCHMRDNGVLPKGGDMYWWIPDGRTVVIDSDKNLRRLLERKGRQDPQPPWADGWRRVENCLAAGVFATREGRIERLLDPDDKAEQAWAGTLGKVAWVTAGWGADGGLLGFAECGGEEQADQVARTVRTLLKTARLAMSVHSPAGPGDPKEKSADDCLAEELLSSASLTREGTRALFRAETRGHLEAALQAGMTAAAEGGAKAADPGKKP